MAGNLGCRRLRRLQQMEGGSKNKGARRRNNGGDGGEKEWGFDAGENVKKTAAAATAAEVTVAVAPELWEAAEEETRSHRATARAQTSGRREARAACCTGQAAVGCNGGGGHGGEPARKSQRPATRRAARKSQRLGEPRASASTGTCRIMGRRLIYCDCREKSRRPTAEDLIPLKR